MSFAYQTAPHTPTDFPNEIVRPRMSPAGRGSMPPLKRIE
jgi:hypothetical protein